MRQWKQQIEARFIQSRLWWLKTVFPSLTANRITCFRLLPAGLSLWFWPAGLYSVAAILDWLDGAWARANNENSRLGKTLDPAIDKIIVLGWLFILSGRGVLPFYGVLLMASLDGLSQIAYRQKIFQKHGANIFGQSKKALQDSCVLTGILAPGATYAAEILLLFSLGAALLSLGAKFQLKKTPTP